MFGALGRGLGAVFNNQSKFNPMNAPGLKQIGGGLGMRQSPTRPMGPPPPQGIGPGMDAMGGMMNKFGMGMQKPPQMAPMGQEMMGMQSGMKPEPPPPMNPMPMQEQGLGPSMGALGGMMGQPSPAPQGPMPDFMNRGGEQPLNHKMQQKMY